MTYTAIKESNLTTEEISSHRSLMAAATSSVKHSGYGFITYVQDENGNRMKDVWLTGIADGDFLPEEAEWFE